MVQEELKDIYEDSVIYVRYPGVPWGTLGYPEVPWGTLGYPLWCEIYDILRYQSWNISDCRKMVVINHFSTFWNIWTIEVLSPQWFKKNWKISVKTVLFMQDMKYFQSLKYFSIIEIFSIMRYLNHCGVIYDILRYLNQWGVIYDISRYPEINLNICVDILRYLNHWGVIYDISLEISWD